MRNFLILAAFIVAFAPVSAAAQTAMPYPQPHLERGPDGMAANLPDPNAQNGAPQDSTAQNGAPQNNTSRDPGPNPAVDATNNIARSAVNQALGGPPQPVTLSAKITDNGPIVPNGLVWRIYSTQPTKTGELTLLQHSDRPTAVFTLAPGEYLAQVSYGLAQTTDTVVVEAAPVADTLVLDAGALRLNAQITGQLPIDADQLSFEIYPQGIEDNGHSAIVAGVKPGQMIHLNAGVYHIVSHFGTVNAIVRTDLRVDAGQLTDATLYHDAAPVSFRLVSQPGGEAIADVEWTVKNSDGQTVYSNVSAFPATILAKGDYTVLAQRGDSVYNRDFSVTAGPAEAIEVLTKL